MQIAIDAGSRRSYDAEVFLALDSALRSALNLCCPGAAGDGKPCGAIAHFRRPSRDGRSACFTASHRDGCSHGSVPTDERAGDAGRHVLTRANNSTSLVLTLSHQAPSTGHNGRRRPDDTVPGTQTRRHTLAGGTQGVETDRRWQLATVLSRLVDGTIDDIADLPVRVQGFPELPVREFFVHCDRTTPESHAKRLHGYWGSISSVRHFTDPSSIHLHLRLPERPRLKIVVPTATLPPDLTLENVRDTFPGRLVLALGTYRISEHRRALYIYASSFTHIATIHAPAVN